MSLRPSRERCSLRKKTSRHNSRTECSWDFCSPSSDSCFIDAIARIRGSQEQRGEEEEEEEDLSGLSIEQRFYLRAIPVQRGYVHQLSDDHGSTSC